MIDRKTLMIFTGALIIFLLIGFGLGMGCVLFTLDKHGQMAEYKQIRQQLRAYIDYEHSKFRIELQKAELAHKKAVKK